MKNCKMAFTIGLVFAVMMLVAACTDSNKSDNHIFDHESLDVDEYVYPSDFDLGDDLKGTNSESDAGFEELSAMIGTYHYTSDYGTGRLMIEATEDGIDISDYESEDTYRFLANETNVKNEEENLLEKVMQTPKYRLLESYVKTMDILELVCTFGTSLKIPHCRMGRRRHVFYQIMVFQKMSRLLETLLRHCVMIKF